MGIASKFFGRRRRVHCVSSRDSSFNTGAALGETSSPCSASTSGRPRAAVLSALGQLHCDLHCRGQTEGSPITATVAPRPVTARP